MSEEEEKKIEKKEENSSDENKEVENSSDENKEVENSSDENKEVENSSDENKEELEETQEEKQHNLMHKKIKDKEDKDSNKLGDAPKEMINAVVGLGSVGLGGAIKIGKDIAEKSLKTAIKIGDTTINGTIDTLVGVDERSIEEITRESRRKLAKSSQIMKILSEDPDFQKNINEVGNLYKKTLTGSKDDVKEITELYKTIVKDISEALGEAIVDSIDVGIKGAVGNVPGVAGILALSDAGQTWFEFAGKSIKSSTENGFKIWDIANRIGDKSVKSSDKIVENSNEALQKYDDVSNRINKSLEESHPKNTVVQKGGKKTRRNTKFKKTRKKKFN
jgi:hypothetical protein